MPRVGCAGLLVEDIFCGPLVGLPPEGALTILEQMPVRVGGCAANVAIGLSKQGVEADVAGCVGKDPAADLVRATFASHNIGAAGIASIADESTSKTVILLIEGQDRRYFHVSGANSRFNVDQLSEAWLSTLDLLYLGGLFGLPGIDFLALRSLLERCQARGIKTVVDVVTPDQSSGMDALAPLLPFIDMFVPNDDEARTLTGLTDPIDQIRNFLECGARSVIVTQGQRGSTASDGKGLWRCGTYHMDVIDPSGSGDAFTSGVIRCLLEAADIPTTLRYASALGASATRAAGTTESVFTADEAKGFIANHKLRVAHES
jgi:sugar/nucleoside kinase (ribokinase family)